MSTLEWRCACGTLTAEVTPGDGTRAVCYCDDCQAYARALGAEGRLDAAGGTDLYQTVPDRVRLVTGADQLAALTLSGRGPIRWYAGCCNTPFCNTIPNRHLPFASFVVAGFRDTGPLPAVAARVNRKFAHAPVEAGPKTMGALVRSALMRAVRARLSGRWKKTPFFDEKGAPVAAPRAIRGAERDALYPDAG